MRYLGIDFGLRRIGLAVSEGELAAPLKIVEIRNLNDAVVKMIQIILTEKIDRVVVGIPEGETGRKVAKFIKKLQQKGTDVVEADETLSTLSAMENMIKSGVPRSKRRFIDAQAAAEILQNYLDDL